MEKIRYADDFAKSCSNCMFCDTVVHADKGAAQMFCRHETPKGVAQCVGIHPQTQQPMWVFATTWPSVTAADWCAHHSRKVNA